MSEVLNLIPFVYGEGSQEVLEEAKSHPMADTLYFVEYDEFLKDPKKYVKNLKILVCASLEQIKELLKIGSSKECEYALSIIAQPNQVALRESFHLSPNIQENITQALQSTIKELDMLFCDDEIALYSIQIGDTPPLSYLLENFEKKSLKDRFKSFLDIFKKFKNLKRTKVKITTDKDQEITTVASGIVIVEHDNRTFASKIVSDLRINNSKLSALIISPPSITGYLLFLIKTIFTKPSSKKLPPNVGLIESKSILIESDPSLEVRVDGKVCKHTPVKIWVKPKAIKMALPDSFWEMEGSVSDKESIKLTDLPTSKEIVDYQQNTLPLFTHAAEDQYQSLFTSLRDEAKPSSTFITLILLSTLLATVGLYLNSSSVIIGAMLLAPLMQPIVSFSMGVLRIDEALLIQSLKTIAIGVLIALVSSSLFALLMPFQELTSEMSGRLKPSILDLFVALISGAAAAYAKNNEKIVGSLVGVSIAVALVPPIAVSGIGLGWGEWSIFYHAFLLFLTNLAGIVFAAGLIFLVQGYSPIKRAKHGILFSLLVALAISIPLYVSFKSIKEDADIKSLLIGKSYIIDGSKVDIESVVTKHIDSKSAVIDCELLSKKVLDEPQMRELKRKIQRDLGKKVTLEAVWRILF